MPLPRASIKSFLAAGKHALKSKEYPFTFVIGNESADLDSLCCAVVLAYLRTYASQSNSLYIPLSNLLSADLALRPELGPVLAKANLKPSDLITLSDLPQAAQRPAQLPPDKTKWILVDHNALQGDFDKLYSSRIAGCIDHHDEEGKVPKGCGEEPRIVQKSGSCASLVVEHCREAWEALSTKSAKEDAEWDAELAHLALAPVLIDTTNLTIESKVMPEDSVTAKYLENIISIQIGGRFNAKEYFDEVSKAKEDIEALSLPDILRKDYKKWTEDGVNLGISSVVKDLRFLIDKAGSEEKFVSALQDFAKERDLSICSIMTTSHTDGEFRRELFVWGLDDKGKKAVKTFETCAQEKLCLEQWTKGSLDSEGDGHLRRCWWQGKVENSRKQVAPLLRSAITEGKGSPTRL